METKVIQFNTDTAVLKAPARCLAEGGLVAFPTETVYGLGANAFNTEAVAHIFQAKGRPQDNPLIVHVSSHAMLRQVVRDIPPQAEELIEAFWPGPLTIIFEKADCIPNEVTAGLSTVAVRMPAHPAALALIEQSGVPVAAPSANLSGSPSTTRAEHVIADLSGRVDYIIDGGACRVGLESTVLDVSGDVPQILRPGGVGPEALELIVGTVTFDAALKDKNAVPKCPGMKYRHYAPHAELILVEAGAADNMAALLRQNRQTGRKTGALSVGKTSYEADFVIDCGETAEAYAKNLFDALRRMDDVGVDVIVAQLPQDSGGIVPALKNRLMKAAGGKVVPAQAKGEENDHV